jgi:hypothetical protein
MRRPLTILAARLVATLAAACPLFVSAAAAPDGSSIPSFFFSEWTVTSNCAEEHSGLAARVATGLKFTISADSLNDGNYILEAKDTDTASWASGWNGLELQYRPGPVLTTMPADFACVPGQESSSPFLALSGFAQAAEPYYEEAHWYGLATIAGQQEHVLIFVRSGHGPSSAVIMLQSVQASSTLQLDDDGIVVTED